MSCLLSARLSSSTIHHWRQDRLPAGHIVTDQRASGSPAELLETKRRRALVHADPLNRGAGLIEGDAFGQLAERLTLVVCDRQGLGIRSGTLPISHESMVAGLERVIDRAGLGQANPAEPVQLLPACNRLRCAPSSRSRGWCCSVIRRAAGTR
jgi:hypothetical protein